MRAFSTLCGIALIGAIAGCAGPLLPTGTGGPAGGAAIVGTFAGASGSAKLVQLMQDGGCPEVRVTINGTPVTIVFDDDCGFLVTDVDPTELLDLRVEVESLGIAGTVEIVEVSDGELIEIEVAADDFSLAVNVVRRVKPTPGDVLPTLITGNNLSLQIGAGVYEQDLTVAGNRFTLVGEAGDDCDDEGWSVIDGKVVLTGNKATFRNIVFLGDVQVLGNAAQFINCCFDGELVIFGNATSIRSE